MAKRELSNTLRNLKFMQRGANKEDKTKEKEEIIPNGNFASNFMTKKCMVIMEGDPSPGAIRGRMSFQSFNPSIDDLTENEEPVSLHSNKANGVIKRKQVEVITKVPFPNNSPNIIEGNHTSSSNNSRKNSNKRGKLDFNVLRSPNSQNSMG